jgi:outer membrane protein assembly factor BamB
MWERRFVSPFFLVAASILILLTGCGRGVPAVSWFGIAASDDAVYLAANEQVVALNLESGAELWAFPPEPDTKIGPFYATPLLTNDALIVGGFGDGKLYAVSYDGGAQEWAVETGAAVVEGAVSADVGLVVGNSAGSIYRVEAETQEKQLLLETDEPIWALPLVDEDSERIYVASMDHHLYAINLADGEQLWTFEAGGALAGTPALGEDVIYFGALNSTFYALDAETGAELWRFQADGWVWGGPLVHDGNVYFGDMAGKLYALDAEDGSERWPAFEVEGGVRVTPVAVGDLLYFGTRGSKVYAVRAENGTQEWAQSVEGAIYSQPVVRGEFLLVAPHNAKTKVVALNTESGAVRWSYPRQEE